MSNVASARNVLILMLPSDEVGLLSAIYYTQADRGLVQESEMGLGTDGVVSIVRSENLIALDTVAVAAAGIVARTAEIL
jgi:hypothetical protein